MKTEGVVVSVNGDIATVAVTRQSACAGCSATCADCHKKQKLCLELENSICAEIGESVWIESSGKRMLALCVLLFVLPTVLAAAACFVLNERVGDIPLFVLTAAVAALCFVCLYMTAGKRIVRGNTYRLVKKY